MVRLACSRRAKSASVAPAAESLHALEFRPWRRSCHSACSAYPSAAIADWGTATPPDSLQSAAQTNRRGGQGNGDASPKCARPARVSPTDRLCRFADKALAAAARALDIDSFLLSLPVALRSSIMLFAETLPAALSRSSPTHLSWISFPALEKPVFPNILRVAESPIPVLPLPT